MTKIFTLISIILLTSSICFATPTPSSFSVEPSNDSIEVSWSANTDEDTVGYYIYWEDDSDDDYIVRINITDKTTQSFTITGLEPEETYNVYMTAYDGSDIESTKTVTESVDTTELNYSVEITGTSQFTVSINYNGSTIVNYQLTVTSTDDPNFVDYSETNRINVSQVVTGVTDNYTYAYTIRPLNSEGNLVGDEETGTLLFETSSTMLSSSGDLDDGCFIITSDQSSCREFTILFLIFVSLFCTNRFFTNKLLLVSIFILSFAVSGYSQEEQNYKNIVGIKVGYFDPSESLQGDVYDRIVPASLYYERMLTRIFSVDIEAGYSNSDGNTVTSGSSQTGIDTELELIPLSMSLNANFEITPQISFFFGAGGDWWNYKEKSPLGEFDGDVGGWHAKSGVKLLTDDDMMFRRAGMILEANYAQIDRFGDNDIDLGGWTYNLGFFYSF